MLEENRKDSYCGAKTRDSCNVNLMLTYDNDVENLTGVRKVENMAFFKNIFNFLP